MFLLIRCVALICRSHHPMVFNGGKQVRVRAGGKSPADPQLWRPLTRCESNALINTTQHFEADNKIVATHYS
jgi:hypothetical protein